MGTAVTELTFCLLHSQEARCREYIEKVSPRVFWQNLELKDNCHDSLVKTRCRCLKTLSC